MKPKIITLLFAALLFLSFASCNLLENNEVIFVYIDTTSTDSVPQVALKTLTLQPGSEGKDAYINSLFPNAIGGLSNDFCVMAWTNSSNPVTVRSMIDFDLSAIPQGSTIKSAYLSLYNNPTSVNNSGKHSDYATYGSIGADNATYLKRVTSNWDESTISWNTQPTTTSINQVLIPSSTDIHQDYPNIDVTKLIKDIYNNKSTSFGMMLQLRTEAYYRGLIFASGDNADPTKRPKLVINYQ